MLHSSYSFALAYEANLVAGLLERLPLDDRSSVLDPFCGTGTTLLESKLHGFPSIGVDANPVCVLVSRAKTDWGVNVSRTSALVESVLASASREYASFLRRYQRARAHATKHTPQSDPLFTRSPAGKYLVTSGLIRRGWIGPRLALKTLLIAERLWGSRGREERFLILSLLGLLVPDISNMSYGPEIYRALRRTDRDVFALFKARVDENLERLKTLKATGKSASARVRLGDSANGGLEFLGANRLDAAITSPPYLSDHDYTRLTRLELIYSGSVTSHLALRKLKKRLLRSSSKNVYKDDCATEQVRRFASVRAVIKKIEERAATRSSGFARVYPKLVGEYFGGMYKHFQALGRALRSGGCAAYIVADQSSFFATPIPTAQILAHLAEACGASLHVTSFEPVKEYHGTRGRVTWSNQEWLILLRKGAISTTQLERGRLG